MLTQGLPKNAGGGAHGALHFIEHNAFKGEITVWVIRGFKFEAMTLLHKIQFIQTGEKYRIQVDVKQVEIILAILAGKGVGGPVAGCERVHESIQRAANHHEEGIAHRIAFTAAQNRVLKDVCDACGILWNRSQANQEGIFTVIGRKMKMRRTSHLVAVFIHLNIEGANVRGISVFERFVMRRLVHQADSLQCKSKVITVLVYVSKQWRRCAVLPSAPVQ